MEAQTLKNILHKRGYSLTTPRSLVFEAMRQRQPISAAKLADSLNSKVDRASVYRTLNLFENLGVLQRVWLGFKSHFELSEAFSPHHHHLTCLSCGTVVAIEDKNLEASLAQMAQARGFSAQAHQVEISGLCQVCHLAQLAAAKTAG